MTEAWVSDKTGFKNKLVAPVYVHKLCRCCLCEVHQDYFWLEGHYLEKKILDIYQNVISIKIVLNDYMPEKLCASCYDLIIKFDLFKNKVLESEKILAENALPVKTENIGDKAEIKTENATNIETVENAIIEIFEYDIDDGLNNIETSDSEDEKPIFERLRNELKLGENDNTENENKNSTDFNDPIDPPDINHKVSDVLQVLPKRKHEKSGSKKKFKKETSDDNWDDKQKRERRKESCKECGKVLFAYKMENHKRTHTKEKPYVCEKCDARFSEKSNLNRHVKIHGNDRPYKCGICRKGFLRPSSRSIHEMTAHKSEKNILCPICSKGFKHQYFLNKHMTNIHNKSEVKIKVEGSGYPCPICGNFYRTKSSLRVHKMKHEQPRAFLCNVCGNAYSTKAVLENHQKVHTGEKNFCCSICDKKFRFISTLKTHILVHSGEKPLSCHICNKQFRQHSHLNTHIRGQHSTNRPYQCSFCSKTFKQSCNLTVHTRIHTGETPYHCDICQKGFYDSSSMKKHKKSHFDKNTVSGGWVKVDLDVNRIENNSLQT